MAERWYIGKYYGIRGMTVWGVYCEMCDGYGEIIADDDKILCPACKGAGWVEELDCDE